MHDQNIQTEWTARHAAKYAVPCHGTADIGMSSRDPKDKEITKALAKGVLIKTITVAKDGIAVIVNESNPMNNISIEELEMVFAGDVIDWSAIIPQAGRISAYTRNTSSGTYAVFQKMAMNSRDYGDTTQKMSGNEQIATEVARNPNGIGYVGLAYIDTPGVKVLTVDGELPRSTEYPLARPLYYIVNGNEVLEEDVKRFIEFTFSDEGQDVVEAVHFLRIKWAVFHKWLIGNKINLCTKWGLCSIILSQSS